MHGNGDNGRGVLLGVRGSDVWKKLSDRGGEQRSAGNWPWSVIAADNLVDRCLLREEGGFMNEPVM
jgi:hypothetical protein